MCKVLLVDDEKMARMGLRAVIDWDASGFELVGEASNGEKAMRWVDEGEVDILITDIAMPVMDGLELTRIAKEKCPWIKVLLLSCHSDFEYVREGVRLGASDYILKPMLEEEALLAILRQMRAKLKEERENQQIVEWYKKRNLSLGSGGGKPDTTLHQRLIQQATAYIDAHFTSPITLQQAADKANVSRNYFSEMFKRVTGQNFIDYIIALRVNRAKQLLQTSSLKVYEVAEQSGFNDVKHFSKQFKKIVGCSPAEFQGLWQREVD
ncbi:response regulator [Paenibacillus sp. GCM10027626]|uniref:response regulator transcription factor n=1 Tax=Paenibacillus sp. GCM10027626 TaxID=3273411 RepID=UPI003634D2CB